VVYLNDKQFNVTVNAEDNKVFGITLSNNEEPISVDMRDYMIDDYVIPVKIGDNQLYAQLFKSRDLGYDIQFCGSVYSVDVLNPIEADLKQYMKTSTSTSNVNVITSPMAGTLVSVAVKPGDKIVMGQEIAVVEAMKMQNILRAQRDGVVKDVKIQPGKPVSLDEVLVDLAPLEQTKPTAPKSK